MPPDSAMADVTRRLRESAPTCDDEPLERRSRMRAVAE